VSRSVTTPPCISVTSAPINTRSLWRLANTLQQYVGRLYRLHDNKRFVQVYDYVDNYVLMLARMYERRLKGYAAIGYVIEQETSPPRPPAAAHP
jgi:superfamily II DNA or RNA helicase